MSDLLVAPKDGGKIFIDSCPQQSIYTSKNDNLSTKIMIEKNRETKHDLIMNQKSASNNKSGRVENFDW